MAQIPSPATPPVLDPALKPPLKPAAEFGKRVAELSGAAVSTCFQCQKCSNGCPLTFAMDILPHQVVRLVQMGSREEILRSETIWVCASCETCTTRCPNNIDIAHVMDTLRQLSAKAGVTSSQKDIKLFHDTFLASIRTFGRVHEAGMAAIFALRSGGITGVRKQAGLGLKLMSKGKIRILPHQLRIGGQLKQVFSDATRKDLE